MRIQQWDRLVRVAGDLKDQVPSLSMLTGVLDESADLAAWFASRRPQLLALRDDVVAAQATIRTHIESWIDVLNREQPAVIRLGVAERLSRKVDGWIRSTREEIFAPIGEEVINLWSLLNPDADLKLTGIALAGGTQQQRKVALNLADGDVELPTSGNSAAVLSTGQRNALSLATYLPRSTQPESPFGFLILDDPIHAFDSDRVRYLAQHLIELSQRFQVIVFTHDDRLWRELRALAATPGNMRLDRRGDGQPQVRITTAASPGIQRLNELRDILNNEQGSPIGTPDAVISMTLAICRQAVDTEVVAQIEILGRRVGSTDAAVARDLKGAKKTLDQLNLLNDYARRAGFPTINANQFRPTVHALNGGTHGRAPGEDPKFWVRQTRKIIEAVQEIGQ
jgi:hypothetical protein